MEYNGIANKASAAVKIFVADRVVKEDCVSDGIIPKLLDLNLP